VVMGNKKFGGYSNSSQELFVVSDECTHLKGMIVLNKDGKSWDCPCNGSRLTYTGKAINGLAKVN